MFGIGMEGMREGESAHKIRVPSTLSWIGLREIPSQNSQILHWSPFIKNKIYCIILSIFTNCIKSLVG